MNREQMIAWLILEGYQPWAYPDLRAGFTLSRDGNRGVWCGEDPEDDIPVHDEELVHEWDAVPTLQLERGYLYLTTGKEKS